ncbi:hypothetical protein VQL36_02575 [Chengkuizengella sp. SCS-71B]
MGAALALVLFILLVIILVAASGGRYSGNLMSLLPPSAPRPEIPEPVSSL